MTTSKLFFEILDRDVLKLKEELSLYKNESDLWLLKGQVKNSAGTLALHIAGNLKHYIGAVLGNTGYVRQRDKEFSDRNVPRGQLLAGLEEARQIVNQVLLGLSDEQLGKEYPIEFMGRRSTHSVLIVLVSHLGYHLGQVNYHRRLLTA